MIEAAWPAVRRKETPDRIRSGPRGVGYSFVMSIASSKAGPWGDSITSHNPTGRGFGGCLDNRPEYFQSPARHRRSGVVGANSIIAIPAQLFGKGTAFPDRGQPGGQTFAIVR